MTQVTVVGGGLAGLACAVALADHGIAVTVIERSTRLGGRASCWHEPVTGDVVDIGPHIYHSEYHNMLALLGRLGTRDLICWQPGKVLTIASKPKPTVLRHYPLPAPLSLMPSILGAPGLGMADYLSMAPTGWRGMRFGEEQVPGLDRMSGLDFFRSQGISDAHPCAAERLPRPALRLRPGRPGRAVHRTGGPRDRRRRRAGAERAGRGLPVAQRGRPGGRRGAGRRQQHPFAAGRLRAAAARPGRRPAARLAGPSALRCAAALRTQSLRLRLPLVRPRYQGRALRVAPVVARAPELRLLRPVADPQRLAWTADRHRQQHHL